MPLFCHNSDIYRLYILRLFPVCARVFMSGWLLTNRHDWNWIHCLCTYKRFHLSASVWQCLLHGGCLFYSSHLWLILLWLLPNHNTGIMVQSITITHTHTQCTPVHAEAVCIWTDIYGRSRAWYHAHMASHLHTYAQLHALMHRHACPPLVEAAIMPYYRQWNSPYASSQFQSEREVSMLLLCWSTATFLFHSNPLFFVCFLCIFISTLERAVCDGSDCLSI